MKMLIDKIKLKLLLEEKRDYINHSIDGIDIVISENLDEVIHKFSLGIYCTVSAEYETG